MSVQIFLQVGKCYYPLEISSMAMNISGYDQVTLCRQIDDIAFSVPANMYEAVPIVPPTSTGWPVALRPGGSDG